VTQVHSTEGAVIAPDVARIDWDSARGDTEKSALLPDVFADDVKRKEHIRRMVTTAKPHWCQRCEATLPAKTRMRFDQFYVIGNVRAHRAYTCLPCCALMDGA
jgi:hypothetical protein